MEMDLFATPKRLHHPSTTIVRKTPLKRKLIVDDDTETGSEKKGQSRTNGGGLRQFSVMVCQKLEAKKITTHQENMKKKLMLISDLLFLGRKDKILSIMDFRKSM